MKFQSNHDSSDESHDENDRNLQPSKFLDAPKNALALADHDSTTKIPTRTTNLRKVPSRSTSGGTDPAAGKSFVPRAINAKNGKSQSQPVTAATKTKRFEDDQEDEAAESGTWTKVPKKFLDEPDSDAASNTKRETSKAKPPQPTTSRPAPQQTSKPSNFPTMSWQNQVEGIDMDGGDDEEASAHTEESGDENSVESDTLQDTYKGKKGSSASRGQKGSARGAHEDASMDPTVIQDGEFFADYRAKSLAGSGQSRAPTSRPNKSGRYTEDAEEEPEKAAAKPSGGWMGEGAVVKKPPAGKTSWASVQQPVQGPSCADFNASSRYSFVMVAHARGVRTEHVQCTVVRDRRASINGKLHPTYELILEETNKPIILAQKMNLNRTSNYHLFDLTRAQLSTKFSKKSGNYLGKLRAKNINRTEYVLLNQNSEREEIAGVRFDRVSLMNQIKDGNQPRKMKVMVPPVNEFGVPIPNRTQETDAGSLAEKLSVYETTAPGAGSDELFVFESKDPVFENGNFRLNFHGRVSKPSVKNFQMVSREDIDNIICQFGKVNEDVFHLDFKAPLNAYQAFAFALCQFNL
jgi:tubby-related protein 1